MFDWPLDYSKYLIYYYSLLSTINIDYIISYEFPNTLSHKFCVLHVLVDHLIHMGIS